jgi:(E)-4-hydroxy-3-methyl-but-2-enyl pyrophosphate reductase
MKTIKAKNIGSCFGVKNAITITEKALKEKARPVQFLGSLVHNEKIIEKFLKKKIVFQKDLKQIKPGVLIIQAHGFPPFPKKFNKQVIIKDATCPLVKKVQKLAQSLYQQKYQIIIIGDKNHSEVKGIKGYAKNKSVTIENKQQAEKLFNIKNKKLALICQTTQDLTNVKEILKVLKKKNPKIKFFDTVCPEVIIRQTTARQIAKKADQILIIGSKTSANTKRLYQISKKLNKQIYWINSLTELKKLKINKSLSIGLISGTSADDSEIKKIEKYLLKL